MNRLGKWLVVGAALSASAMGGSGCLTRPVGLQPPTTKVNFTSTISQQQVDKVDLLFMIDNSSSMADKQAILKDAVPNLIGGLLKPACVNTSDGSPAAGGALADPNGSKDTNYGCPANTEPEFKPVSDMHIGIISSSLGTLGGDVCPDSGRFNDHAHLLNYADGGGDVAAAKPSNFLAWFPTNKENSDAKRHPPPTTPTTDITKLTSDFQSLVVGTGQTGCGFEAQLEAWYHFLIAPDPWVKITVDSQGLSDFGADVDTDLLQQRADFLRPDSLVAIISLSDETDSSVDPQSLGGQGWAFAANQFPGSPTFRADGKTTTAPRATSACQTNPGSPDCTSCGFAATCDKSKPDCQKIVNDPECQKSGGYYGPTEDQLNVRFHRMKERYGIDPQYPIRRYVDGLTKTKVADRKNEHPTTGTPGKRSIGGYAPVTKCTNPLFAANLPRNPGDELCNLAPSTRTSDLVFFAHIGGVPNQLLHFKAGDADASRITNDDWNKILGRDPLNYNYDLIDSHMIESISPRPGLPAPSATRGDNGTDPIHGREWDTGGDDLQYACTFNLPVTRTCAANDASCDCGKATNPPLCGATAGEQIKAKAYPTVREFEVVRALGDNGIAASLCPIQLADPNGADYGYKPAVAAIIDRLKNALTTQCLPQQLTRDTTTNQVPCLVLAQLGDVSDNCANYGLKPPAPEILSKFLESQKAASGNVGGDGGVDLSKLPVCEVPQETVAKGDTCKDNTDIGWCYVENNPPANPAGRCPQALIFTSGSGQLSGARFSLQCIQQFNPGQAAGDPDAGP
jgi:hypothetical protein